MTKKTEPEIKQNPVIPRLQNERASLSPFELDHVKNLEVQIQQAKSELEVSQCNIIAEQEKSNKLIAKVDNLQKLIKKIRG